MIFEYIVSFAVLLSNVANFPQIYKIVKNRKASDLSLPTFIMWSFITLVLAIHAVSISDIYFIVSQFGQFLVNVLITVLILKYR